VVVSVLLKALSAYCLSLKNKEFTFKERIFIAITYIPKAAVQAGLSGLFLEASKNNGLDDYEKWGLII
jgi:hypothetical protein